jgi:alpha-mannosidase
MDEEKKPQHHLGVYLEGSSSREGFPGLDLIPEGSNLPQPDEPLRAFIIPHTHADLCWPEIPDYCIDTCMACIDDIIKFQGQEPGFKFSMEHAFYLRQYLMRHPEASGHIINLIKRGHFECGAFYLGPTELTAGGESLIRELYLGKRWLKEKFDIDARVAWNVDCPGHTQQLPQILEQADVPYFVIWKEFNSFEHDYSGYSGPCLFRWVAPDGSEVVTAFTPGGYGIGRMLGFRDTFDILSGRLPGFLEDVAAHLHHHHLPRLVLIADGTDVERPTLQVPENIRRWNEKYKHPGLQLATSTEFFDTIDSSTLPESQGEAPNWWDTIGSFQNERVMGERHCEPRQAAAEAFSAMASHISKAMEYPTSLLERIWENRLFASEHNSGGRNGVISDSIKLNKIKSARLLTDLILDQSLAEISLNVDFQHAGIPIIVFNSLLWSRRDLASIRLQFQKRHLQHFKVIDCNGVEVPFQYESINYYEDETIKDCCILISAELPALGYAVFYIVEGQPKPWKELSLSETNGSVLENRWFRFQTDTTTGYPISLVSTLKGEELLDCRGYLFGELIALENLAHDEDEHFTGNYWRGKQFKSTARLSENGPLRAIWTVEGEFKGGYQRLLFIFYRDLPRIDIAVELDWHGEKDLQVMQAFPFQISPDTMIHYGVPFGNVKYGEENPDWIKIHPSVRGVRDWVHTSTGQVGITLASEVIPFELQNRISEIQQDRLIQPILLKTTYSCHDQLEHLRREHLDPRLIHSNLNNPSYPRPDSPEVIWHQTGHHLYRFSLQVDADGFDPARSARFAAEHQTPYFTFVHYEYLDQFPHLVMENIASRLRNSKRILPESMSFASCESRNVIPTWVKQAEDGKGIIIRCYEANGKRSPVEFTLHQEIAEAWKTDILEYDQSQLPVKGNVFSCSLEPYKIGTFRVKFRGAGQ